MNPAQKEILRQRILLILHRAAPCAVPLEALCDGLHAAGYALRPEEVEAELKFMCEKGLAGYVQSVFSAGLTRYALTADGRDALEKAGLA